MTLSRNIVHHHLDIADERYEVEVWADTPVGDDCLVTLYVSGKDDTQYVELTPAEARALAALLIVSADRQERRL